MAYDILFITSPANGISLASQDKKETFVQRVFPPLGVISLACNLKKYLPDIHIEHIDFNIENPSLLADQKYTTQKIKEKLTDKPIIVCISIMMSSSYSFIPLLLKSIKQACPDAIIICGGTHTTAKGHKMLEIHPEINYVVCGEGEEAFPNLCMCIINDNTIEIQGVHSRDNMHFNNSGLLECSPFVKNIDIPFHLYSQFPGFEEYCQQSSIFSLSQGAFGEHAFAVMASRGCPVRCSFCASGLVHGSRPRWRSLENIQGEMMWLHEHHKVTKFYIMDDNFIPKEKTLSLFKMFSELPIQGLEIVIQNMSVNHTDFEIIDALIKAGVTYLPLAIESGVPEMQKKMGKYCNLEKAKKLVSYAQSKNLQVRCFYILGFPGETVEEMNETIRFASEMDADWSTFSVALPFPGTRMYEEFIKLGYMDDTMEAWKATNIRERTFDTKEISAQKVMEIAYRANLNINFVHNRLIREGMYKEAENIFKNFIFEIDFHLFAFDCLRRIYGLTGRKKDEQQTIDHMIHLFKNNPRSRELKKYFDLLDFDISQKLERSVAE